MNLIPQLLRTLLASVVVLTMVASTPGADKYVGQCDVVFAGDSTLHAFTGNITNIMLVVFCDTNASGAATLSTRLEIAPKQLTTHSPKRDANMYEMFQQDRFPKLVAVVTNALLAAAKPSPSESQAPGTVPVQLTFCGITREVPAKTFNPKALKDGWEFDLQADLSLKSFKLEPPSAMFGVISVDDTVKVKAHIKVQ